METLDLLLEQFKLENLRGKSLLCELTEPGTLWPLRGLGDLGFHGPGGVTGQKSFIVEGI